MWVKICANTNLEDTLVAAQLGADAVGFVFAPSARQMTPDKVAQITPHLPTHIDRVGVFPAWTADQIGSTVAEAGLTTVQLHAAFDPELTYCLRKRLAPEIKLLQAVHWQLNPDYNTQVLLHRQVEQIETSGLIDRVLIDSKVGSATGGTGKPFEWTAAEALFHAHPNLILAGGLRPRNISQAIERLKPWGVDVASGVEAEPGRKDPENSDRFLRKQNRPVIKLRAASPARRDCGRAGRDHGTTAGACGRPPSGGATLQAPKHWMSTKLAREQFYGSLNNPLCFMYLTCSARPRIQESSEVCAYAPIHVSSVPR